MARKLTEETVNGVTETFAYDLADNMVHVRHTQDAQPIIDFVAAANRGGIHSVDGLGMPVSEVPITVAMDFCRKRGIPWEKFCYTTEYDDQWGKFLSAHPNLAYRPQKKYHAGGLN